MALRSRTRLAGQGPYELTSEGQCLADILLPNPRPILSPGPITLPPFKPTCIEQTLLTQVAPEV